MRDEADEPREQSMNEDSEDDMGGHNLRTKNQISAQTPSTADLGGVTLPEVDAGNPAESEEKLERRYPQSATRIPNYLADYAMGSKLMGQRNDGGVML